MEIKKVSIVSVIACLLFGMMPLFTMQGDPDGSTDIFDAIAQDKIESVKYWLGTPGFNINAKNEYGNTALMSAVLKRNKELADLLIGHGADFEAKNNNGYTALMKAATLSGNVEIVGLLLERGANIEAKNNNGDTALMIAATKWGNVKIVRLLLDGGADINAKDEYGYTALMKAATDSEDRKLVGLLLERGANIEAKNNNGDTALMKAATEWGNVEIVGLLLERGANIEAKNNNGDTALMIAATEWGNVKIVRLLLERGANIEAKNNNGDTALMRAAKKGEIVDMVTLLLEYRADINVVNNEGQSVLMLLVMSKKALEIIESLVTIYKANPYQVDLSGLNAFDYANRNLDITSILAKTEHQPPVKQEQVEKYQSVLPKAVGRMEHIRRAMDLEKGPWLKPGRNSEGDEEKKEAEDVKEEAAQSLTPTEAHYQKYKEKIDKLYPDVLSKNIVQECLEKERNAYKEGKYVFYRAEPGELRVYEYFIQELYRIIRLYSKQAPFIFTRFFKDAAAQKTINEYVDSVGGKLHGRGELPSMLLSANIPLFGNVSLPTSCTWDYFLKNTSVEQIDVKDLFRRIFAMYGFNKKYQEQLVKIAQSIKQTAMASLQQIIVPKEVVDNVAMLAQVGYCVPWPHKIDESCWDAQKGRHTKISPLLDKYKDPQFVIDDQWQVRLLMNTVYGLNPDSGIEFHVYTNTPENVLVKTQNQISEITDQLFTEWLTRQLGKEEVSEYLQEEPLGTVLGHIGKGKKSPSGGKKVADSQQEWQQERQQEQMAAQEGSAPIKPWLKDKPITAPSRGLRSISQSYKPASIWEKYAQQLSVGKQVELDTGIMNQSFMQDCVRDQKQNAYIPEKDKAIARVATYNVHKWLDPQNNDNYKSILDTIKAINADVLVLQEVVFSGGNTCRIDFKKLGYEHQVSMDTGNGLHNMIVSKYPFVQEPTKTEYTADQKSERREKRNFINTRVQLADGNTISVYGTHLDVWDESGKKREEEVKELLAVAGKDKSKNILLAADWNAIRKKDYQYSVRSQGEPQEAAAAQEGHVVWDLLEANFKVRNPKISSIPTGALDTIETSGFKDSFTRANVVVDPTYTVWTGTVVDFIFCAPTWQLPIAGSYVYYSSASDHVPVIMDIALKPLAAEVAAAAEPQEAAAQ